jgi:transposase-like protein
MELHRIHRHNHAGYPDEIRQTAVKMYLLEMRSKAEIIRRYGFSYASLDKWILKFGPQILADNNLKIEDIELSLDSPMKKSSENPDEQAKKIIELQKQLERSNLKISLLETMIDIAENELNIPIRKKSGPQPSKEKHKKTK